LTPSSPPIEHFVEEAVARIVVMLAVAAETELFVQVGVERRDAHVMAGALVTLEPSGRRFAHALEPLQVRPGVERRILDPRDRKRRRRERFPGLVDRAEQILGDPRQPCLEGYRHGGIVTRTHVPGLSTPGAADSSRRRLPCLIRGASSLELPTRSARSARLRRWPPSAGL
jgi:hypothetical protein